MTLKSSIGAVSLGLIIAAAGCGGESEQGSGGTGGGPGTGGGGGTGAEGGHAPLSVEWSPCSLDPGANDGLAECALVEVPLRWGVYDGQIFRTAIKRLLSSAPEARTQVWLLAGGPGQSGTINHGRVMQNLQAAEPTFDVYTIDARGTGDSEWLGCPDQEAPGSEDGAWVGSGEIDACVAHVEATYGDRLDVYGATQAARDVGGLIEATREPDKRVVIWGGSGGTFWAQRYLHFHPDQVDGIIIEGVVPPTGSLVYQDEYDDLIARQILQMCSQDALCSSKLPTPEATLANLYDKIDAGHCANLGLDVDGVKGFIRGMNYYHPTHAFTPGFIYRLDRCDPADVAAIVQFYQTLWGGEDPERSFSTILFFNEVFSELWAHESLADDDAIVAYLEGVHETGLVTHGLGFDRHEAYLKWPTYVDPFDDQWASSDVPMLMLQGAIDPSTPAFYAQQVADHYNGPNQTYALFPYGTHNIASGTPTSSGVNAGHCGLELYIAFANDPAAPLDTSCINQAIPLDFEGAAWAPYLLGEADYFENGASMAAPPNPVPPIVRNDMRELGRRLRAFRR